jgi:hypothetical protein
VAGGYDETLKWRAAQGAEDWKLIVKLAAQAPPILIERRLVCYRQFADSMSQGDPRRQLRAIFAVIDDLRLEFREAPEQWFRDARTMMIAWLLPAFVRCGFWTDVVKHGSRAYFLNPCWLFNEQVRWMHAALIEMALARLGSKLARSVFSDAGLAATEILEADGVNPFAFLANRARVNDSVHHIQAVGAQFG